MVLIIFLLFTFVLDVCATILTYMRGEFLLAVILGFCSGTVFINLIWFIKDKIEA